MQKIFIVILIIILVVVIFALKNAETVLIDFWFWKTYSNLSLVIILSVTFGALTSFLLSLPYRTKKNKELKERDERIDLLEDEIIRLKPKANNKLIQGNDKNEKHKEIRNFKS